MGVSNWNLTCGNKRGGSHERLTTARKTLNMEHVSSSLDPDCRCTMELPTFVSGKRDELFCAGRHTPHRFNIMNALLTKTILSAFWLLYIPLSFAQQEPGPFDLPYDRGRVVVRLSTRASSILSVQAEYLQLFYYNRSLDRLLPEGYPTNVYAGYYSGHGQLHVIQLYDDGSHLDRAKGDGIFANYVTGPLDSLVQSSRLDEFFVDTGLDTIAVKVRYVTPPYKSVAIPKILVPLQGSFDIRQSDASILMGSNASAAVLFVDPYYEQLSSFANPPLWRSTVSTGTPGYSVTVPFSPPMKTGKRYLVAVWALTVPTSFSPMYSMDIVSVVADSAVRYASPLQLVQNYPNPFDATTVVTWKQRKAGPISLEVFDVVGRRVAKLVSDETFFGSGTHSLTWNGCNRSGYPMPTGTYIVVARSLNSQEAMNIVLIR